MEVHITGSKKLPTQQTILLRLKPFTNDASLSELGVTHFFTLFFLPNCKAYSRKSSETLMRISEALMRVLVILKKISIILEKILEVLRNISEILKKISEILKKIWEILKKIWEILKEISEILMKVSEILWKIPEILVDFGGNFGKLIETFRTRYILMTKEKG